MKMNKKNLFTSLCVLAMTMFSYTGARAQLSSDVGGSLSQGLDANLNGLDSSVAPIPSSSIEPGAGNLETPDERILPYDALGASLVATSMSPMLTQFDAISHTPFRIDTAVRDVTIITGTHSPQPIVLVDQIARKPQKSGFPSALLSGSSSTTSMFSTGLLPSALPEHGNLPAVAATPSSWRVGSTPLAINPIQSALEDQASDHPSDSTPGSSLGKKQKDKTRKTQASGVTQTEEVQDYSKSPLESANPGVATTGSPLERMNENSFLNPNIISPVLPHDLSTSKTTTSSSRTQQKLTNRQTRGSGKEQNLSRAEIRLQQASSMNKAQKPKWHNPILQQWEQGSSTPRR